MTGPRTPTPAATRLLGAASHGRDALRLLTDLGRRLLSLPAQPLTVQVSLLTDVQVVAAASGLPRQAADTRRLEDALCTVTAAAGHTLVVPDTRADTRVSGLPPVVAGEVGSYLGVPLLDREGLAVGALCAYGPDPRAWTTDDVEVLELLAETVLAQLEAQAARHLDQERAVAVTARVELMAQVGAELAAAGLDTEGAVARLARLTVPVLADWCLVSLTSDDGRLRDVGQWHADPERGRLVDRYVARRMVGRSDLGAVQRARDTARPVVVPAGVTDWVLPQLGDDEAREVWLQLETESIVVVPLVARGHMTGVLTLCRHGDRPAMNDEEVTTATLIASRAALTLDNARLYAQQRGLAEGLQRSLLSTPLAPEHCEVAVRYVPAAEAAAVGGDWFDSFRQRDGATVLVIGDVTGHDTAAAAAMGQLRGLLRGIAWQGGGGPAEVLAGLDAAVQGLEVDTTATAVVVRLEQTVDGGRLRWSNAGHPPPLLAGADGEVAALGGPDSDLLLGYDPATPRSEGEVLLPQGATLLLYTDGLVERRGQDLDVGLELLRTTLRELAGLPLPALCDALLARLLPVAAADDVALLAVRLRA